MGTTSGRWTREDPGKGEGRKHSKAHSGQLARRRCAAVTKMLDTVTEVALVEKERLTGLQTPLRHPSGSV